MSGPVAGLLAPALAFLAAVLACGGVWLLLAGRASSRRGGPWAPRLVGLLVRAGGRMRRSGASAAPADLSARIDAAGRPGGLGPREVMAAKLAAAAASAAIGLPLSALAPGRLGLLLALAAPVAGFLGPDVWLARRAADRARRVRRQLPAMLDLLRVTVEAGASLPASLRAVGERAEGPLALEWRAAARESALGVPLAVSLRGMADRLPEEEVRALVAALERARRHGAPLGETLAAQAADARLALARRVREDAARAGPKIQLVVALMLVPSVLLLVGAALAAALLDAGTLLPL